MKSTLTFLKTGGLLVSLIVFAAGCPLLVDPEYELGFAAGFLEDDWYWTGFDDSYDTVGASPLYYQGSDITYVETPPYDAGYWDGVWYAYNDGYFVAYDYAFTIGFSEGYDVAFYPDYLAFLGSDEHVEYANGGWDDGYDDGFSEGRVFGANDYEMDLAFDWLDALLDYRQGTDLYFEEVNVGTGTYGPVDIYVYGTDPAARKASLRNRSVLRGTDPAIRVGLAQKVASGFQSPELSYRGLTSGVSTELDVTPSASPRTERPLTLTTSWLQRVNAYVDAANLASKTSRPQ